PPRPIYNRN
nr:Chain B, Pyrrhocoricin [Pyrrhocoris apterus]